MKRSAIKKGHLSSAGLVNTLAMPLLVILLLAVPAVQVNAHSPGESNTGNLRNERLAVRPGLAARVTGKITGDNGQPLAGVSVTEKGTTNGTSTDNDGNFALTVPDNAVLAISYVGYESQDVPVGGQSSLNIQLKAVNKQLESVVVVGYGSQKKKDLTGAVSVVTGADIANRPIVNAAEALQGKAAGVQVVSNSGKPGAGLTIRIRGSSSISAGNDPLYVVDGIPMTDIDAFSPNDIESISILKDAASASIYGTRAANGVVVVTTKKGIAGKSRIDFSAYYGTSSTTKKLDVLNSQQYQDYMNTAFGPGTITDSLVKANNINWPDEVFRDGHQVNYQLSVAGGSEKSQHYISFGYSDQVGMIRPSNFDRLNGRINLNVKANDWLSFITSTVASRIHNNDVTDNASVARGGVVLSALATPPTVGKYNADGSIAQNPLTGWENPLGAIEGQTNKNTNDRIVSNLGADVKLAKGLVFQSRFGIDYRNNRGNYFLDPFLTQNGRNTKGSLSQTSTYEFVWLSEQTLTYSKTVDKHRFTALAGWTAQDSHWEQTVMSGSELDPQYRHQSWDEMYLRTQTKQPARKVVDEWALISYLGRITYDYNNRYLFQANLRSDHSSKFAPENRVATFPSFSAGWRISQEDFMDNVSFISDLKIRGGWGQNGNQEGIGSYEYLSLTNIDPQTGATSPATIAPQDLRWETSTQTNIGLDASLFKGRINFTADYYIKKSEDVLVRVPLSSQIVESVLLNMGSMQNKGVEFMISSKNLVDRDLTWTTDLNLSFNRNKVLSIGNGISFLNAYGNIYERGNSVALVQGYGLGEFYGYQAAGVDPATGDQLYMSNAGEAVNYSNIKPSDRRLMGSAQPNFVYGMTNNLSYKNLDLTVFFRARRATKYSMV
jgi:TonB-linked SusC/RagA family outer membrane protein